MLLPTKQQILAAVAKTESLAPAPRTLGRALQLLRNPDSGLGEIVDLISRDSALVADVLHCANSAYYGRNTRIAAIGEAVQLIGFHETIRLVSLVAIRSTTNRDLGGYGIAADEFWTESLFNGLFYEALAKRLPELDAGEAYTVGLLRFIGRLVLNQTQQDLGVGVFWDRQKPLPKWEREHLGITQAEVGGALLRRWQFPESMVLAVEAQDTPAEQAMAHAQPIVPAMNLVACILPAGSGVPAKENPPPFSPEIDAHPFARAHQLTTKTFTRVCAEAQETFTAIRETLYG